MTSYIFLDFFIFGSELVSNSFFPTNSHCTFHYPLATFSLIPTFIFLYQFYSNSSIFFSIFFISLISRNFQYNYIHLSIATFLPSSFYHNLFNNFRSFYASSQLASLSSVLTMFPAVLSNNFQSIFHVLIATSFIFLPLSFNESPSTSAVVYSTISNSFILVSPSFSSSQFASLTFTANLASSGLLASNFQYVIIHLFTTTRILLYFNLPTLIFSTTSNSYSILSHLLGLLLYIRFELCFQ